MKNQIIKVLLLGALSLAAGSAGAVVDYYLAAKAYNKTLPDGSSVSMWGYVEDVGGDCYGTGGGTGSHAGRLACVNALAEPVSPGPRLIAGANDPNFRIFLTNGLPESTSIVIPGQEMPWSGNNNGPTWNNGGIGGRTNATQRVRSFGREAAADGGRMSYRWTNFRDNPFVKNGSYVYHSGTHPQKQLYMGLYGAVTKDTPAGEAYPAISTSSDAVTYDNEVILFYSEIDPELNSAIAGGTHETSIHYHPRWFLVNGEPYVAGMPDITTGTGGVPLVAGEDVLLRFFSAAGETHVPVLQGLTMTIHAEDGMQYNYQDGATVEAAAPREQYSVMLPPLKTKDAIVQASSDGRYAIYDGNGYMTNPTDPNNFAVADDVGGMLRFLSFGGVDSDNDGVVDSLDQCPNTPAGEPVDANGCSTSQLDSDNDGVTDNLDLCPGTPVGEPVDLNGCSASQLDDDNDGVPNVLDQCPNTPIGEAVDADGCAASQLDSDNDGVTDNLDLCPGTPVGEPVDLNGCSASQLDDDNDGVPNVMDLCPNTPAGEPVDANGCSASQVNVAPVATDNTYSIGEAGILNGNVITDDTGSGSDSDANGDALTATQVGADPANAAAFTFNSDGSFSYRSVPDYNGPDTFIYEVSDGNGGTDQATVTINVTAVNDLPVANDDLFYLNSMETTTIAAPGVLANDTDPDLDPLTAQNGVVSAGTLGLSTDGSFTYLPEEGINNLTLGTVATFTYEANDGTDNSDPATVTLNRTLTVNEAVCERLANNRCDWRIQGTKSNNNNVRVRAFIAGTNTRIGTVRTTDTAWTIEVNNSNRNTALNPIDVRVLGANNTNARIFNYPVTEQ